MSNGSRVSFRSQPRNYTGSMDEKMASMSPEVKEGNRPPTSMMETIGSARQKILSPIAENPDGEVRLGSNPTISNVDGQDMKPSTPKLQQ